MLLGCTGQEESFRITSPNGRLVVEIHTRDSLSYTLRRDNAELLAPARIGMTFSNGLTLGESVRAGKAIHEHVSRTITAPFYRQAEFTEEFNQLHIRLNDSCAVTFRLYDDGCAYRFETDFKCNSMVMDESAGFAIPHDASCFVAYSDGLCNAFQFPYDRCAADSLCADRPIMLPMVADCGSAGALLIGESDLESYPGMFLSSASGGRLHGTFAGVPDSCYFHKTRCQKKIVSRKDYIAAVQGTRTYPWRIIAVADTPSQFPMNNMVYALAAESRIDDLSWIKPGKAAWEWWNHWGLTDTDFRPGINTRTYKEYIDFASKYGLEYVIVDEGWYSPAGGDVMAPVPEVDLPALVGYAAAKNVGIILWVVANSLDEKLEEACAYYAALGVKGFKVDFIDRDDQTAVDLVYRLAEATAAHRLILDLHGIYKPTGLNRTYPHILNFEGVYGLEELKWSNPDMPGYDVTFPFIRMVQGPADYTPGAFRNASREAFKIDYYRPMSQGTRAHQVAAYIVFDAPLTTLCDSPSLYDAESACTRFIASLPTVYDRMMILAGEPGEYIVTARKRGEQWFIGAMTDWKARNLDVGLPFLDDGRTYTASILSDADPTGKEAQSYTIGTGTVDKGSILSLCLAPGGGMAAVLTPES